jgi:hypothetical protein
MRQVVAPIQKITSGHLAGNEAMQKAAAVNLPMEKVKQQYDGRHRYFGEDTSERR